MGFAVFPVHIP